MTVTRASRLPRYLFIASSAYSGSTLYSYLLGTHPDVATISDVSGTRRKGRMDEFACSCGKLMKECRFWRDLGQVAKQHGVDSFDLEGFRLGFDDADPAWLGRLQARSLRWSILESLRDMALRPLGSDRKMHAIGARNWAFAQALSDLTGASAFVDASKERMRIRNLARFLPTDLFVIHLVRDVRGVVNSTVRREKWDLTPRQAARRWAQTNASILRQLREVPAEQQIRILYEDLCRDPDASLRQSFRFLGVDPDARLDQRNEVQHLLGNQIRMNGQHEIRLDETWRQRLSAEAQNEILRAASPTFEALYATPEALGGSAHS
jgi:hypothetical protein